MNDDDDEKRSEFATGNVFIVLPGSLDVSLKSAAFYPYLSVPMATSRSVRPVPLHWVSFKIPIVLLDALPPQDKFSWYIPWLAERDVGS